MSFKFFPAIKKGEPSKREPKTPIQKLHMSVRVTSDCRYRAAIRLRMSSQASFIATTVLSLGLILIPLFQNAGIKPEDEDIQTLQDIKRVLLTTYL